MNGWSRASLRLVLGICTLGLAAQVTPPPPLPEAKPLRAYARGMREPVRLTTDGTGHLYIADASRNLITVRDESGRVMAIKSGFLKPLGLALDASGRIFVCEAGAGRVSIFTSAWVPAGALGQGNGEFQLPNHIQVTSDGLAYVVDSRANLVKVYGPNGLLIRQFGGYGSQPGQFDFPTGLAVTPGGEIIVSDQGNERMQVFDASGTFLRAFGKANAMGTDSTFGRIHGLLSDDQGRIYLADAFRGLITVISTLGDPLGTIGSYGSGAGQLQGPTGLALDRNHRLFVAAPGNARIELFGLGTYQDPSILDATLVVDPGVLLRNRTIGRRTINRRLLTKSVEPEQEATLPDLELPLGPAARSLVSVLIKMPGIDPTTILTGSITANGVPAAFAQGAFIGDFDQDGQLEYRAWFDEARLVATMPNGEALLVLSGRLSDGRGFESIADVQVLPPTRGAR